MRTGIILLVLVAVLFGAGFWHQVVNPICKTPVTYRIGDIDERFGTDEAELRRIAQNAERLWEEGTGSDLFTYADDGALPINLVFDERQENTELERQLREDLEAKEGMSDHVAAQYDDLISEFRRLREDYESRVLSYESRLGEYNKTVTDWNAKGGAPPEELEELKAEQEALKAEQEDLEARARELNSVVAELNQIGARGNTLITDYNKIVEDYNTRFSEAHEYTQGDHSMEAINIYQFNTEEELMLVLAHEMGHALSLGHVDNSQSIMYRRMGEQKADQGLSAEDLAEYNDICGDKGIFESLLSFGKNAY